MKKILCVILGIMLLLFSSNSLADEPICKDDIVATGIPSDIPCVGLLPASKWCKCIVEWNLDNPECNDEGECEGQWVEVDDGIWEFECYLKLSTCLQDLLPLDNYFCNKELI